MRLAFAVSLLLLATCSAWAQAGAEFTTRDPIACPLVTGDEPPTLEQADQLVACDKEGVVTDWILLTSDNQITSSSERDYDYGEDSLYTDIDPTRPVYSISGSYVEYQCSHPSPFDDSLPAGHTCQSGLRPTATGTCYRMNSGYWACHWRDFDHSGAFDQFKIPGPQ